LIWLLQGYILTHIDEEFVSSSTYRKLVSSKTSLLAQCLATGGARTAFPGTTAYTNARIVNNLRNRYAPAAFVFPTTIAQVQNAVHCAKQSAVCIAPRGGGHSYEDYSLGK
jgi:hypothetical protein